MATYRIQGVVTQGGAPISAFIVAISRETFTHLGHGETNPEDGNYLINVHDHPGPVIVMCFHAPYTDSGDPPYFVLGDPTKEAEIHDNVTPVLVTPLT